MARGPRHGTARRVLWFVALWAAGVGTVAVAAFLLRGLLRL